MCFFFFVCKLHNFVAHRWKPTQAAIYRFTAWRVTNFNYHSAKVDVFLFHSDALTAPALPLTLLHKQAEIIWRFYLNIKNPRYLFFVPFSVASLWLALCLQPTVKRSQFLLCGTKLQWAEVVWVTTDCRAYTGEWSSVWCHKGMTTGSLNSHPTQKNNDVFFFLLLFFATKKKD